MHALAVFALGTIDCREKKIPEMFSTEFKWGKKAEKSRFRVSALNISQNDIQLADKRSEKKRNKEELKSKHKIDDSRYSVCVCWRNVSYEALMKEKKTINLFWRKYRHRWMEKKTVISWIFKNTIRFSSFLSCDCVGFIFVSAFWFSFR